MVYHYFADTKYDCWHAFDIEINKSQATASYLQYVYVESKWIPSRSSNNFIYVYIEYSIDVLYINFFY